MLYGAIEAGGTKVLCGVGLQTGELADCVSIPTRGPTETIRDIANYFRAHPVSRLGVASFGPLDLDPQHSTYGAITNTPKVAWRGANFRQALQDALQLPVVIDTDVNAAVLAEHAWGAATHVTSCLYLTIGTGVGGGIMVDHRPLHGLMHPEMGHIGISRKPNDPFPGICPTHADCLEGLASGPAMAARWQVVPYDLPDFHPAWALEADYLAQAIATYIYVLSPQRIILGGGVMQQTALLPAIRRAVVRILNGYIARHELLTEEIDNFIVPAQLGQFAGLRGGLWLALAYEGSASHGDGGDEHNLTTPSD